MMKLHVCSIVGFLTTLGLGCQDPSKADSVDNGAELTDEELDETEDDLPEEGADFTPTWYEDVKPIVESRCESCHQEGGVGTFSLVGADAVKLVGSAVIDAVEDRRMPPWRAEDGCADYSDDISLTQEEIDTLVDWYDGGMPDGDANLAKSGEPMEMGGLERVDVTLELPMPYAPEGQQDDYRCFPVQWPVAYDSYVTGYVVNPDRQDLVHHVIAYTASASYTEALMAKEAEDGRPGYSCFGGPEVIDNIDASWMGAWAPGAAQGMMPNGLGIYMEPESWVILQVHYNLQSGAEGEDLTTIDVQIEEEVDTVGWIQPFADPMWLLAQTMNIPAGDEPVTHSFSYSMGNELEFHSANLHMHTLGQSARMSVTRADGTEDCMLEIDDWDFNWQRSYVFQEPMQVGVGDTWNLECTWDNNTGQDANWGDGTSDEMCLGTVLVNVR